MTKVNGALARRWSALAVAVVIATAFGSVRTSGQTTTCAVTSAADSGPGTLRDHVANAACAVIVYDGATQQGSTIGSAIVIDRDVTIKGPFAPPDAYLYPDRFAVLYVVGPRGLEISQNARVTISGLVIYGGINWGNAGGIVNRGTLSVSDSEFAMLAAVPTEPGLPSLGGAIHNAGTLTVVRSHFQENQADKGGGIYNVGTLTAVNSSFDRNFNGAVYNALRATLTHVTMTNSQGVGLWQDLGSVRVKNSIVAGSSVRDCQNTEGDWTVRGVNFQTDGSCPQIAGAALQDLRFGVLHTYAELLEGSVAIDAAGDCTLFDGVTPVGTDERGIAKPQGAFCDVGSFEFVAPFTFTGFLSPLQNTGLNAVKAGQQVSVKFRLGGDRGLGVLAPGFPASTQVDCATGESTPVVTPASGSLSYNANKDIYTYTWQTQAGWMNSCRDLTLLFADGSTEQIRFQFRK